MNTFGKNTKISEKTKAHARRIIGISYAHKLSHIGSCLTALPIIEHIFEEKKPKDKFVLSSGHAGLALYVVLEDYGADAEKLLKYCGIHPERNNMYTREWIDCSTGSLGQGLPIAVGLALANPDINVYCLVSDGELYEGSTDEAFRFIREEKFYDKNLKIYANMNGYSAYKEAWGSINVPYLTEEWETDVRAYQIPFMKSSVDDHYHVMTERDYMDAMEALR